MLGPAAGMRHITLQELRVGEVAGANEVCQGLYETLH